MEPSRERLGALEQRPSCPARRRPQRRRAVKTRPRSKLVRSDWPMAPVRSRPLVPWCRVLGAKAQLVLAGATVLFAQAAEFEVLTGLDAKSPKVVDTHVDLVMRLLLPGANNGPET